ncbi:glutathione transport system permease protein [Archangium gephyra]|uniref:Dipeptide transport system permease protein DppB n=1 Tax=Archangium gephyra TaxID=48 RepID=A0AAC8TC06_9BACT|nr:Dipeptide transport system permease protein DppB [Archangium gephyra]REG32850.1 glutathione transport system permease protein [Archangium gephyra]
MLGLEFGALLGGAIVTEKVFAWPGMGTLLLSAIEERDYNTVPATVLGFHLLGDAVRDTLDPKHLERQAGDSFERGAGGGERPSGSLGIPTGRGGLGAPCGRETDAPPSSREEGGLS